MITRAGGKPLGSATEFRIQARSVVLIMWVQEILRTFLMVTSGVELVLVFMYALQSTATRNLQIKNSFFSTFQVVKLGGSIKRNEAGDGSRISVGGGANPPAGAPT